MECKAGEHQGSGIDYEPVVFYALAVGIAGILASRTFIEGVLILKLYNLLLKDMIFVFQYPKNTPENTSKGYLLCP
jgi:hypothetical protein